MSPDTLRCCDAQTSAMVSVTLPIVTSNVPASSSLTSFVTLPWHLRTGSKHASTICTSSPTPTPSQSRPMATRSTTDASYVTPGTLCSSR